MPDDIRGAGPRQTLSVTAGASFLIGIVVGIGIFRTPSLVAANVPSEAAFMGVWLAGGLTMLLGALCYAELGSAHPSAGGEYHFLRTAYGHRVGLLFAWARGTVIQTGAIAAVAFVYGDYASTILPLGPYGGALHAVIGIAVITAINLVGTRQSTVTQVTLTMLTMAAVLIVIGMGFASPAIPWTGAAEPSGGLGAAGLAMVFVLLTYGGWNEVAYLSGEMRDVQRNMIRALVLGTVVIMVLYLAANYAYLRVFGLEALRGVDTVGAELVRRVAGDLSALLFSLSVCACALSTLNATVFTGGRAYYALGRDVPLFRRLGVWSEEGGKPANALLLQAAIALGLVAFGAVTREGFESMVAYTAPVFWFFLMLVAGSVIVFRRRRGPLPYRMPLYPLPPLLFGAAAAWMVYSSVAYAGAGALLGIAVVAAGLPLLRVAERTGSDAGRAEPPAGAA